MVTLQYCLLTQPSIFASDGQSYFEFLTSQALPDPPQPSTACASPAMITTTTHSLRASRRSPLDSAGLGLRLVPSTAVSGPRGSDSWTNLRRAEHLLDGAYSPDHVDRSRRSAHDNATTAEQCA